MSLPLVIRRVVPLVLMALVSAGCSHTNQADREASSTSRSAAATGPTVEPGTSWNFDLVGSDPLFSRGMNSALALYRHYAYVGNLSDGSDRCSDGSTGCPHPHPGVLVVDVADPSDPGVVGEIGPPHEGLRDWTSRELRVWPQQKLLLVMNFDCEPYPYVCGHDGPPEGSIDFYDLSDPVHPRFVSSYQPPHKPHEMFLWVDHRDPGRAVLYVTMPAHAVGDDELVAVDVSGARNGLFRVLAEDGWTREFRKGAPSHFRACGGSSGSRDNGETFLHSLGLNDAGTRAYLAYWCGQMVVIDTSEVASGQPGARFRLLTPIGDRPRWGNPHGHSAVKVPGGPYVLVTDEVYGSSNTRYEPSALHSGCPWGWVRLVEVRRASDPRIAGEYRIAENTGAYCRSDDGQDPANTRSTSYSAHNPTVLPDVAFVAWHSGGLQAIDLSNPADPVPAGFYAPDPLASVATENPIIGMGTNKDLVWSYPILRDGLLYVVDIRNGLFILRYTGPHSDEVDRVSFLEGNSNLGDSAELSR